MGYFSHRYLLWSHLVSGPALIPYMTLWRNLTQSFRIVILVTFFIYTRAGREIVSHPETHAHHRMGLTIFTVQETQATARFWHQSLRTRAHAANERHVQLQ